ILRIPRPGIAKPNGGQQMKFGCFWTAIVSSDADENVFRCRLRVFNDNVEVAVFVKDARIDQFEFRIALPSAPIFLDQLSVRESCLRVLIQKLHVRVCRSGIKIEVVLLHVFSVVAFASCQAKQPLLENWIAPVPESHRKTYLLVAIAD